MFYLILFLNEQSPQLRIELESTAYLIGRHSNCNFVIQSKYISRFHSSLILITDENNTTCYLLKDGHWLGNKSTSGTWVNAEKINNRILKNNDVITFSAVASYPKAVFLMSGGELDTEQGTLGCEEDA